MVKGSRFQFLAFFFLESAAFAHSPQGGDIWASTGPFLQQTQAPKDTEHNEPRLGWGVIAQGDVDANGGVEIGLIYTDKTYILSHNQDLLTQRMKRMYVTTGYRHWFFAPISAALAVFSSYSMGDVKTLVETDPTNEDLKTTAETITEYGLDVSLQWEVFAGDAVAVVADARYSKSLSAKKDEKADQVGAMLAFKYLIPKPKR